MAWSKHNEMPSPQLLAMGLTVEQVAQALSLSVEEVQRLG
jgi:predicted transposase YdaD